MKSKPSKSSDESRFDTWQLMVGWKNETLTLKPNFEYNIDMWQFLMVVTHVKDLTFNMDQQFKFNYIFDLIGPKATCHNMICLKKNSRGDHFNFNVSRKSSRCYTCQTWIRLHLLIRQFIQVFKLLFYATFLTQLNSF